MENPPADPDTRVEVAVNIQEASVESAPRQRLQQQQQHHQEQQQQVTGTNTFANVASTHNEIQGGDVNDEIAADSINASATHPEGRTSDTFYLQFSKGAKPFNLPEWVEVAAKGMEHFNDPGLRCPRRRLGAEYIYLYQLTKKVPCQGQVVNFSCNGVDTRFTLTDVSPFRPPRRTQRNRMDYNDNDDGEKEGKEKGILVTFKGAGDPKYDSIPMEKFDEAVAAFKLEIIVPTRMQNITGTRDKFNGNRYCVIRIPADTNMIPEFLPVTGPNGKLQNFPSTYLNQARYCSRCMKKHVGQCPSLKRFYEAKKQKEEMMEEGLVETNITADSTLRHADDTGTTANIVSMSGGGLGQIAQAVIDNPDNAAKKEIFIIGGANDIKFKDFTLEEYCENIEGSLQKIKGICEREPEKKITVIQSYPQQASMVPDDDAAHPPEDGAAMETDSHEDDADEEMQSYLQAEAETTLIKAEYFRRRLDNFIESCKTEHNIDNLEAIKVEYEIDNTNHPTIEGTKNILNTIATATAQKNLIWNPEFTSTEKPYTRVQSLYIYGCNHCYRYGEEITYDLHRCRFLCDLCYEGVIHKAEVTTYPILENIMEEVNRKKNTPIFDDNDFPGIADQQKITNSNESGKGNDDEHSDDGAPDPKRTKGDNEGEIGEEADIFSPSKSAAIPNNVQMETGL